MKIPVKTLKDQEMREEVFPLQPVLQEELAEKPGEIHIRIKYHVIFSPFSCLLKHSG